MPDRRANGVCHGSLHLEAAGAQRNLPRNNSKRRFAGAKNRHGCCAIPTISSTKLWMMWVPGGRPRNMLQSRTVVRSKTSKGRRTPSKCLALSCHRQNRKRCYKVLNRTVRMVEICIVEHCNRGRERWRWLGGEKKHHTLPRHQGCRVPIL